jgi:hypothetical protein
VLIVFILVVNVAVIEEDVEVLLLLEETDLHFLR